MATPLSRTEAQAEHIRSLGDACILPIPTTLGSLPSLIDCGRLAADIVLGVLSGISIGMFVALAVGSH